MPSTKQSRLLTKRTRNGGTPPAPPPGTQSSAATVPLSAAIPVRGPSPGCPPDVQSTTIVRATWSPLSVGSNRMGDSGQTMNSYRKRCNSYNLAAEAQRLSVESTRLSRLSIADRNTCDLGCHRCAPSCGSNVKNCVDIPPALQHDVHRPRMDPPALARTLPGIAVKAGRVVIRLD